MGQTIPLLANDWVPLLKLTLLGVSVISLSSHLSLCFLAGLPTGSGKKIKAPPEPGGALPSGDAPKQPERKTVREPITRLKSIK